MKTAAEDLLSCDFRQFGTILADPPWRFSNRTGKMRRSIKGYAGMKLYRLKKFMNCRFQN